MVNRLLAVFCAIAIANGTVGANTIEFTGSATDFDPTHLLEDDTVDTESFDCGFGPVDPALDIGEVYCANDLANLYIGMAYNRYCFCNMQLGIAIDVRAGGGTTDPFNRQIIWTGTRLPDFIVYDVIPTNCNGFNYEVIFEWDGTSWVNVGDGSNAWGFHDTDGGGFKEFAIPLSLLGVQPPAEVCLEMWTTQDDFGTGTKPAFDMVVNDASQTSTPGGTVFDVSDGDESLGVNLICKELRKKPVPSERQSWGEVKARYSANE